MKNKNGWICLHRVIQDHWIWEDPQKLKWWMDILLSANFKESKKLINNDIIIIERGAMFTSILELSERWKVNRKTTKKFLDLLVKDEMITMETSKRGTMIKVSNYNEYQGFSEGEEDNSMDNTVGNGMDNNINKGVDNTVDNYMDNSVGNPKDNHVVNGMDTIEQYNNKYNNKYNNINNYNQEEKEKKEEPKEQAPQLSSISFPTKYHKQIFNVVGEIGYRTWFIATDIETQDNDLLIITSNDLAMKVIQDKYIKRLSLELRMNVKVKKIDAVVSVS